MSSGELSINSFITDLANPVYAPDGGAAAALSAALSSALVCMASSLSAVNPRFSAFLDELAAAAEKLRDLNTRLIALIDRDAEAFEHLSKVYKLPKDTEGYSQIRHAAVLYACSVPEDILLCVYEISTVLAKIKDKCSPAILSDIGCAAYLSAAAAKCAAITVFSNTNMIQGTDDAKRIASKTTQLTEEICSVCEATASSISEMFSPGVR